MNLYMVGVDFERASIAAREPVSFVRGQVLSLLPRIRAGAGIVGCVLLATCNRTELYLHTDGRRVDPFAALAAAAGLAAGYRAYTVSRENEQAARHLMQVAAGLESQIYGDDQILTQVSAAAALAREAATCDPVLDTLFRRAVTAGKRVKTETRLVGVPRSAAELGVCRAEQQLGSLAGRRAVVIGNGEMGRLAASLLEARGAAVTVTLRTYRHGQTVVPAGCRTHPYEERAAVLDGADLVVSATTSPHFTVTGELASSLASPPPLLIDLAMPRDIEHAVGQLRGVTVWNLDDLGQPALQNDADRARADEIIAEAYAEFAAWHGFRRALPVIAEIKDAARARLRHDRAFGALYEENDVDGLLELAVNKTVDLLMGGMKDVVSPAGLAVCLAHMKKRNGT